jgi:replicative DNA helicase
MNDIQLRCEQLILYSIMMNPDSIHDIMSNVDESMFQDAVNKVIFNAVVSLYTENKQITLPTIYTEVRKSKDPNKDNALMECSTIVSKYSLVSRLEIDEAIMFLKAEGVRAEQRDVARRILESTESDQYDPKEVLDFLQSHITDNKFKSIINKKEFTNEELIEELEAYMEKARNSKGVSGIPTGYKEFDVTTSGMQPTNLIIIAARPAMGKTQLALGIMKHASIDNGYKGAFFSGEMSEVQVMKRLVAVEGNIKGYSIKDGKLSFEEMQAYHTAIKKIKASGIKIIGGPFHINDIVAESHKLKNSEGLDYIVVDYLQKISGDNKSNRNNEVEQVAGTLKDLANELKIPVIALAQLSRAVEQRPDRKPMLSDLRDSGSIEQDADIVSFLYRPAYYMEESERAGHPMEKDGYIMIAKHRDGELRDILMKFEASIPAWLNPYEDTRPRYEEPEIEFEEDSPPAIQPNEDFDNDDLPF